MGLEQALKLQEGLFVIYNIVDLAEGYPGILQAIPYAMRGKCLIIFNPGEPLLLYRSQYIAIFQQTGGAVVVIGRYPQNIHRPKLKKRVNKWRQRRTLRYN